jgi:hypothetical protein
MLSMFAGEPGRMTPMRPDYTQELIKHFQEIIKEKNDLKFPKHASYFECRQS